MLAHTKNANAMDAPDHAAAANTSMLAAKKIVTACSSRAPSIRRRTAPYTGTSSISTSAVTATA